MQPDSPLPAKRHLPFSARKRALSSTDASDTATAQRVVICDRETPRALVMNFDVFSTVHHIIQIFH